MYTLRARFAKDIVVEFLPPARSSKKVIIYCAGMPSVPTQKSFMEFFIKKGYWVFFPRYRGTWESGGRFLQRSPHEDILDVVLAIHKPFRDLWGRRVFKIKPKKIFVIGSSFGGAAAILVSRDKRITKAIALSPVIDWRIESRAEPLDWVRGYLQEAFGGAIRFKNSDWKKLSTGKFYNPAHVVDSIDGSKLLLIHAKDDKVVPYRPTEKFAKKTKAQLIMVKRGGHFPGRLLMEPKWYKKISKFFAV